MLNTTQAFCVGLSFELDATSIVHFDPFRFDKGGGSLIDLEFLTNDRGQRVAAFGFMVRHIR